MYVSISQTFYRFKKDGINISPVVKQWFGAFLVVLVLVAAYRTDLPEAVELQLLNSWFMLRGEREIPRSVTIVRLDKPAYDEIGLSTGEMFPRDKLGEAWDKITAFGAKAIVLDGILQRDGEDPALDQRLAEALANSPSVIGRWTETINSVDVNGVRNTTRTIIRPVERFARAAKAVIPLETRHTNGIVAEISLSNELFLFSDVDVPLLGPLRTFIDPELKKPGGFDFINYYGGPGTITNISLAELIKDDADPDPAYFRDRVVLIGIFSEAGAGVAAGKDTFATSISRLPMYGVEIHANIVANLLDGSWIKRPPRSLEATLVFITASLLTYFVLSVSSVVAVVSTILLAVIWALTSYYAFSELYYFVPGLTMFFILLFLLPVLRLLLARKKIDPVEASVVTSAAI